MQRGLLGLQDAQRLGGGLAVLLRGLVACLGLGGVGLRVQQRSQALLRLRQLGAGAGGVQVLPLQRLQLLPNLVFLYR